MKFVTNAVKSCTARIGTLAEFERIPNASFETPLVLIYTKRGSVPHLTKDVFKTVTSKDQLFSISLSSTVTMMEAIKETNTDFSSFVSMKEYINFLSIHDPAVTTPEGFRHSDSISIWSRTGRHLMSANKYMDIVEAFKPDFYVALCDGDTNIDSSKKRVTKAVNNTNRLLETCLNRHTESDSLKFKGILGAVEGGYNLEARTQSIDFLKQKSSLLGYVIDGLHNNGPDVRSITTDQIKEVVTHTVNLLPIETLKVSLGCWNPVTVLDLIELGVDVFDSTYPYVLTENSQALTFLCDHDACKNVGHAMTIAEKRYADDCSPICTECQCLACQNHSRAYLHHLHHTKEMLGSVLLMIHNTHQYLQFFDAIRESIKNGTFSEYQKRITSQFLQSDKQSTNV